MISNEQWEQFKGSEIGREIYKEINLGKEKIKEELFNSIDKFMTTEEIGVLTLQAKGSIDGLDLVLAMDLGEDSEDDTED